jgi:hypothetical protein
MRLAYVLAVAALLAAVAGCGDDDFGADGPSVSTDFAMTMNADLGGADLTPVDLAHD